ncbi:MAG: CtsR family transcriptional regulator [Clostridiales bacterium]|jgi:transcriptional regulator CtsR|nr:CtsR family transcriptional regulator [Clostridiales bacterium]
MSLSNSIAEMIMALLESEDGYAEIQRNELAQSLGCVPSQINYVISSRFTPEQGYIVESRRGGGGYIRISRIKLDRDATLMHVINNVGMSLDEKSCRANILNLAGQRLLDGVSAKIMLAATSDICLRGALRKNRDEIRAAMFKQMLLAVI